MYERSAVSRKGNKDGNLLCGEIYLGVPALCPCIVIQYVTVARKSHTEQRIGCRNLRPKSKFVATSQSAFADPITTSSSCGHGSGLTILSLTTVSSRQYIYTSSLLACIFMEAAPHAWSWLRQSSPGRCGSLCKPGLLRQAES